MKKFDPNNNLFRFLLVIGLFVLVIGTAVFFAPSAPVVTHFSKEDERYDLVIKVIIPKDAKSDTTITLPYGGYHAFQAGMSLKDSLLVGVIVQSDNSLRWRILRVRNILIPCKSIIISSYSGTLLRIDKVRYSKGF